MFILMCVNFKRIAKMSVALAHCYFSLQVSVNSKGELLLYQDEIKRPQQLLVFFEDAVENACFLIFVFYICFGIKFFPKERILHPQQKLEVTKLVKCCGS